MTFAETMQNVDGQYYDLKILKVDKLHKWEVAKFIYKVDKDIVPHAFVNFLPKIKHNYNTISKVKMQFQLTAPRTDIGKSSIKFSGVKLWATISSTLKETSDIKAFSKAYKTELLES